MNANDGLGLWMLVLGFGETEGRAVLLFLLRILSYPILFTVRRSKHAVMSPDEVHSGCRGSALSAS